MVQGVLALDTAVKFQTIIVERSATGTEALPDDDSLRGHGPPLPVSGASVVVTRDDSVQLTYIESSVSPGVYDAAMNWSAPFVIAGRVYTLRVTTLDGRVVTGRTRVPFAPVVSGILPDSAQFNRDRDTLALSWTGGAGTKSWFIQVRPRDQLRRLTMLIFTDSTHVLLPGATPLPGTDDDTAPVVWVAGTRQTLTVSSMDTTFYNFFRTQNDPFTGAGFINSLTGGLGVFGAMAPVNRTYDVIGDVDHPYEGRYQLDGVLGNVVIDGVVELYVTRAGEEPVLVSGLLRNPSALLQPRAELSGIVAGGSHDFVLMVDEKDGTPTRRYRMTGTFNPSGVSSGNMSFQGTPAGSYSLTRLP